MTTKPDCFAPYDAPDTTKDDLEKIQADSHRRRLRAIAKRIRGILARSKVLLAMPDYGPEEEAEIVELLQTQMQIQAEYEELIGRRVP